MTKSGTAVCRVTRFFQLVRLTIINARTAGVPKCSTSMPVFTSSRVAEGRDERVPGQVDIVTAQNVAKRQNTNRELLAINTGVAIATFL